MRLIQSKIGHNNAAPLILVLSKIRIILSLPKQTLYPYSVKLCGLFQMRRNVRPYFLDSPDKKAVYDAGTFFYTRFTNVYLASNFCLLELVPCLTLLW